MREVVSSNPSEGYILLGELAYCNISRQTGRLVGSHPTVSLDIRAV